MKERIEKLFLFVQERKTWFLFGATLLFMLFVYSTFQSFVGGIREQKRELLQEEKKYDYSGDGGWIVCVQEQLACVYANEKNFKEVCGESNRCDTLY